MRILLIVLLTFYIFPADVEGLREIKIGDKVPLSGELRSIEGKGKAVLVYLRSDDLRSVSFFRQFTKVFNSGKNLNFVLVDVNDKTDERVMILFKKLKGEKRNINDPDRKIYSDLGIVVLPSLLFIDEAGVLNSVIISYRSNLGMFFKEHLMALDKGRKPGDVYGENDKKIAQRKHNRMTEQAFTLVIDGNFQLAGRMYKKAVDNDSENIEANLGYGYALFMQNKVNEAETLFKEILKSIDSKRLKSGLFLCRSHADPSNENLENLARFALVEPSFFPIIFEAAEILQKNGKLEMSNKVYKRSYRILLRTYRRNK